MSRRASLFAKQNPGKPRVRFPDEIVFNDNVKENDLPALHTMLRRASLQVDINAINSAGLTPLHSAVLDGQFAAVRLLIRHGAHVNKLDEDHWTPLHAACAEGHVDIARYLLKRGADPYILTDEGERPLDLVDPMDFPMIKLMLEATKRKDDSDDEEEEEDGENHHDNENRHDDSDNENHHDDSDNDEHRHKDSSDEKERKV